MTARLTRWCLVLAGFLLASAVLPARAAAQGRHDAQLWALLIVTPEVAPHWLLHLEAQPRWSGDVSDLNHVILRGALGRRVGQRMSVWGGHGWIPRMLGPGTRHEHRLWQQLSATLPAVGQWTPSLRVRLEQRFLHGWADSSHRLRLMGRAVRPFDAARVWSLALWNEGMVTMDETAGGPWRGADQNRLFVGVLRRVSPTTAIEAGYLWQTMKPPSSARAHAHVAFAWLNIVL